MPVTVKPSAHDASAWTGLNSYRPAVSPEMLLFSAVTDDLGTHHAQPQGILQSSFKGLSAADNVYACKNGFVFGLMDAYNQHHRFVIRPEDVWFAILTQLSNYVNAHAEDLRETFVDHEGQKNLHIEVVPAVLPEEMDHGKLAFQMTKLMAAAIKDASWREWILPSFTTTEKTDQAVASVIFMGTLQKYFTYSWGTRCGLPEVTLLGEQSDWEEIRRRCEARLPGLGKEPERFYKALRPALDGFVDTFRKPDAGSTKKFWQSVCSIHYPNGSGSKTFSGWITAFCFWDEEGKCLHESRGLFGGVRLQRGDVPGGFTKVPVLVLNGGHRVTTEMIAGSLGIRATRSGGRTAEDDAKELAATGSMKGLDTIQPEVGWIMYKVKDTEAEKAKKK